jgi:hypothetical protein
LQSIKLIGCFDVKNLQLPNFQVHLASMFDKPNFLVHYAPNHDDNKNVAPRASR